MFDLTLLFVGLGVGVLVSVPVGPVNILCLQRTFRSGFLIGIAAGLGAVAADGLLAAIAAFGLTAVSGFVTGHSIWLQAVGGLVLLLYGVRVARAHPHLDEGPQDAASLPATAFATFVMTVTNPATVLGTFALFGALGSWAPSQDDWIGAALYVLGVVAGGSSWWLAVTSGVALLRERMTDVWLARINLIAGALLIVFGVVVLGRAGVAVLGG